MPLLFNELRTKRLVWSAQRRHRLGARATCRYQESRTQDQLRNSKLSFPQWRDCWSFKDIVVGRWIYFKRCLLGVTDLFTGIWIELELKDSSVFILIAIGFSSISDEMFSCSRALSLHQSTKHWHHFKDHTAWFIICLTKAWVLLPCGFNMGTSHKQLDWLLFTTK